MNTNLRTVATNDFEKDFFKLMNNSVFGKTMENLRKRIRLELVKPSETTKLRKLIADPGFKSMTLFNNNLYAIHMAKCKLKLNRPIYTGQSILDLSKHLMYDFWYNTLKTEYGDRISLCYTDTDSVIIKVETDDIYADMKNNSNLYDFSDYPRDHPNYNTSNKKIVGKFKDEMMSKPMAGFTALRPKMYAFIMSDSKEKCTAKGVSSVTKNKDLKYQMYVDCLTERKEMYHSQMALRSKKHQMGLYEQVKKSLSPLDTKKWIANDGITTLAYGHYRIPEN